jgi:hypothetical protein
VKRWRRYTALAAALSIWEGAAAAQSPLVSLDQASRLKDTYRFVRFSALSGFDLPVDPSDPLRPPHLSPGRGEAATRVEIPAAVAALHGTKVSVRGYMLPVDATAAGVTTFILTSSIDSCHWGMTGQAHEWVMVRMAAPVPFLKFQPVTVFGRLAVEPAWRGTHLAGLYQMQAEFLSADGL